MGMGVGGLVYLVLGLDGASGPRRDRQDAAARRGRLNGLAADRSAPRTVARRPASSRRRPPSPRRSVAVRAVAEQRDRTERLDEVGVLAEERAPLRPLGHEGADDDRRRHRPGAAGCSAAWSEPPVEITSSTTATRRPRDRVEPGPVEQQRCGEPVVIDRTGSAMASAEVDLRRLVQDHVVVEAERPGHLDRDRDAHRRHRHHDLGLAGAEQLGQLAPGPLGERDAVVDRDEQGDREVVGDRDEREVGLREPTAVR